IRLCGVRYFGVLSGSTVADGKDSRFAPASGQSGGGCGAHCDSERASDGFSPHLELPTHCQCGNRGPSARSVCQSWLSSTRNMHSARIDGIITFMKNELLEKIWRVREQLGAECGYDPK